MGIYSTLGLRKNFCFVLAASGRPWEGTYRRVGQCFKAALWGHEERQKKCAIAFGLGACGEELGFSPKVTLFFSPRTSIGPTGVLPTNSPLPQGGLDSFFLGIYSQIKKKNLGFLEIIEKLPLKPQRASETTLFFYGLALPVGRHVQKAVSKFRGSLGGP